MRATAEEPFAPIAVWPPGNQEYMDLSAVIESTLSERRGVLLPDGDDPTHGFVGYPFAVATDLVGVVALRVERRDDRQMRLLMRQLQWGAGWIELMVQRERVDILDRHRERAASALDMIGAALEGRDFRTACTAVATELATRLACDRVAVGWFDGTRPSLVALSHSADVGGRMNLVRALEAAMAEAIDQGEAVLRTASGPEDGDPLVSEAHGALLKAHGGMSALTVPFTDGDRIVGALCLEHRAPDGFDQARADVIESVAAVVGPILEEKRANGRPLAVKALDAARGQAGRLLGPGYAGRKLAMGSLVLVLAFFAFYRTDYRVTADATLEGEVQRVLAAPFDGYLVDEEVRPGDAVEQGQVLARLDDRDLVLERINALAQLRQHEVEHAAALARGERSEVKILEAQINQMEARIGLIDAQLARTRIVAPFDGIVVSGDHSQEIGASIARGEVLYVVAPLSDYRLALQVDERDVQDVVEGQPGTVRFASLLDQSLPFRVRRITPVAEAKDGRNTFRVEAAVDMDAFAGARSELLPGMEGVGKIEAGRRRLLWIWTHRATEWLRLNAWSWLP